MMPLNNRNIFFPNFICKKTYHFISAGYRSRTIRVYLLVWQYCLSMTSINWRFYTQNKFSWACQKMNTKNKYILSMQKRFRSLFLNIFYFVNMKKPKILMLYHGSTIINRIVFPSCGKKRQVRNFCVLWIDNTPLLNKWNFYFNKSWNYTWKKWLITCCWIRIFIAWSFEFHFTKSKQAQINLNSNFKTEIIYSVYLDACQFSRRISSAIHSGQFE